MLEFRRSDAEFMEKQKNNFDFHHQDMPLPPPISNDALVWFDSNGEKKSGRIVSQMTMSKFYIVQTDSRLFQRNRCHLNQVPTSTQITTNDPKTESKQIMT